MDDLQQVRDKVRLLGEEVGALQVRALNDQRPWYRQASTLIALFALVFSFGTTVISNSRATEQEQRALKQELRALVLALTRQPIKALELSEKYSDPLAQGNLSSLLNQESTIIAEQAAIVASKIPERVSSTEYATIAFAYNNSGKFDVARMLRQQAVEAATTAVDALAALRQQAALEFQLGNFIEARSYFQSAVDIFRSFPKTDEQIEDYSHAQTYLFWAQQEAAYGQCVEFTNAVFTARTYSGRLNPYARNQIESQLTALSNQGC